MCWTTQSVYLFFELLFRGGDVDPFPVLSRVLESSTDPENIRSLLKILSFVCRIASYRKEFPEDGNVTLVDIMTTFIFVFVGILFAKFKILCNTKKNKFPFLFKNKFFKV